MPRAAFDSASVIGDPRLLSNKELEETNDKRLCTRNVMGWCAFFMAATASSCVAPRTSMSQTSSMRSPRLSRPLRPAGLSGRTFLMKIPAMPLPVERFNKSNLPPTIEMPSP